VYGVPILLGEGTRRSRGRHRRPRHRRSPGEGQKAPRFFGAACAVELRPGPAARYLRNVGTVPALAAAELHGGDDRPYPLKGYRFIVVDTPEVNAVGMPGGFIAVTAGALRSLQGEGELAAVLAHEVAHVQPAT